MIQIKNRIAKLRQILDEKEVDAILISQPENRYYLSGFNGSAGYLFVTQNSMILATDFRYVEQIKIQAPDYTLFQLSGSISKWFPEIINGLDIKTLGFESADITFERYQNLSGIIGKTGIQLQLVPLKDTVETIRAIKDPEEIDCIRRAAEISDKAFKHISEIIHAGMTEIELAWELEKSLHEAGSQSIPFEIIAGSGPNAALPHAHPSERVIRQGEPIIIDFGAKIEGYCSDVTRTLCIGKADAVFNKIYGIVLDAQMSAISKINSGTTGAEADGFARNIIEEAGYGEAFGHSLGHGIGLATHENPSLSRTSDNILTENMVFTIEPGIYIPGWGGVRIEDTVIIKNGKISVLSKSIK
ncbi:MAG: aminopeptidase P family protein [Dehalococcoidales bacterium]|nr:aminopeptidase P family protein [Dehalococcoidales bacterium]